MNQVSNVFQLNNMDEVCVVAGGWVFAQIHMISRVMCSLSGELMNFLTIRIITMRSQYVNLCRCKTGKKSFKWIWIELISNCHEPSGDAIPCTCSQMFRLLENFLFLQGRTESFHFSTRIYNSKQNGF